MTLQELDKIKHIQVEIMDEIHRVCVEHSITYYLICGTLLGAVRHKGFIPWDVDIDIAMPRKDYDKFKNVCATALNDMYFYCDYTNKKNYQQPHALVCRKNTNVYTKYDYVNPFVKNYGIYVDVFPLDNAPDDECLREKQAKKLYKLRKFKERRIPYSYSIRAWKRLAHFAISGLLSFISVKKVNEWQQTEMQRYRSQDTRCLCSMASQYAYKKQCIAKEIYGSPVLLDFEGRQYWAPEKYIEYLTQIYGDYMKLPPIEKRQANLDLFVALEIT